MRKQRKLILILGLVSSAGTCLTAEVPATPRGASGSQPSGVPIIVNFSRYDIGATGGWEIAKSFRDRAKLTTLPSTAQIETGLNQDDEKLRTVADRIAQKAVNFRYLRASGVRGAIFQSSYFKEGRWTEDDSFRVWAARAAENDVLIGAYHFYRRSDDIEGQARQFTDNVKRRCSEQPRQFAGRPVLLAFDALPEKDTKPIETLRGITEFASAVKRRTGVWPGFYPENSLREIFRSNASLLSPSERAVFAACWLWTSRYHSNGPLFQDGLLFGLWKSWSIW